VRCINIIVGSRKYLQLLQINAKGSIFHGAGAGAVHLRFFHFQLLSSIPDRLIASVV
jgi:hypothetical protein